MISRAAESTTAARPRSPEPPRLSLAAPAMHPPLLGATLGNRAGITYHHPAFPGAANVHSPSDAGVCCWRTSDVDGIQTRA